ncbi:MAG: hypothetical protein KGL39_50630 [Patescibacteria group bacterium]|nr:hypothetical protein [Patescibacteria group bacterium]
MSIPMFILGAVILLGALGVYAFVMTPPPDIDFLDEDEREEMQRFEE